MTLPHLWRESASLIISRAARKIVGSPNPEFLWIKRAARAGSGSFRGQFAFPGGVIDEQDFNSRWQTLLEQHGQGCALPTHFRSRTPPAFARHREHASGQRFNPELAFKICAIREAFEETGLLLTSPHASVSLSETHIAREEISKDAGYFYKFCSSLNVAPAVDRLILWSDWLTPAMKGWKRFDTIFFVVSLHGDEAEAFESQKHELAAAEISGSLFASANTALTDPEMLTHMAPPQVYEMCRMLNFETSHDLKCFAEDREKFGIERYLPVFKRYHHHKHQPSRFPVLTSCSLFPGDYMYPSDIDPENESESMPVVTTEEMPPAHDLQLRDRSLPLHRLELYETRVGEDSHPGSEPVKFINRFICNLNDIAGVPEHLARHAYPRNGYEVFAKPAMKP